ncbi:MAG: hypothetical protein R3326_04165 [Gemmatimonadota bacterium]|nr:hypothetical protein [Gemmatimonadota bacterium]
MIPPASRVPHPPRRAFRPALLILVVIVLPVVLSACGGPKILRGIFGDHGTFLVRHHRTAPLEIWAGEERLGVADSGAVACWDDVRTGSFRARATMIGDTLTIRATDAVLTPDDPLLWDVDRNQVLPGRVHARLCE